jgi:hypothetical protein
LFIIFEAHCRNSIVEIPVELPLAILVHVELGERVQAFTNESWQICRGIFGGLDGPLAGGQNLGAKLNWHTGGTIRCLELIHDLFGHFDIFEHGGYFLHILSSMLDLEPFDEFLLRPVIDLLPLDQTHGHSFLVEILKHIFVA